MPAERWRREFIACSPAVDEIACGVPAFTLDISGPRIRPDVSHRIERGLVSRSRETLQDNEIHLMSDWGQVFSGPTPVRLSEIRSDQK